MIELSMTYAKKKKKKLIKISHQLFFEIHVYDTGSLAYDARSKMFFFKYIAETEYITHCLTRVLTD